MNEAQQVSVIDLGELSGRFFKNLRRFWLIVLALAVLGAGGMLARSYLSYSPAYESRAIFSVNS